MKKPYTKEQFAEIVARGEARLEAHFGVQMFYSAVVAPVVVAAEVVQLHGEDCRCIAVCFNRKLDEILAKTELPVVIDEEIHYVD